MGPEDLYADRTDLLTKEELEEWNFGEDEDDDWDSIYTPNLRSWLMDDKNNPPEAATRRAFERRSPALGATPALLNELKAHYSKLSKKPVQQRMLSKSIRGKMLRHLIPCDGAVTVPDLVVILEKEISTGTPSPVPEWYKYSTVTMGPRKIGYDACSNRDCLHTETPDLATQYSRCSQCKTTVYCSIKCQTADWKARHKHVCKIAAKQREEMEVVGKMMQNVSDLSLTGNSIMGAFGPDGNDFARKNPDVKERRRKLRAEKKRPKGQAPPDGPDPDFF